MNRVLEFQDHLKNSKRIVALVGAGLSASSGLPTFRGSQGLWKNFNMIDLATPDAFIMDPGLVWQFYSWRRYKALQAQPNSGHKALAKLAAAKDMIMITQNVDGLQLRVDNHKDSDNHKNNNDNHKHKDGVYEIHGSLYDVKCTSFSCNYKGRSYKHPMTPALAGTEEEVTRKRRLSDDEINSSGTGPGEFVPVKQLDDGELPRCPACEGLLRPGVVWFGESLPVLALNQIDDFIESQSVDLILVIGTSGTVYPANSYVDRVRYKGGKVAIFNTDIEQDIVDGKEKDVWGFKGDAAKLLPEMLAPVI